MGCLGGSGLLSGRGLNGGFTRSLVSQSLEIDHSSSVQRGNAQLGVCQFCTALSCLGVRRARSSHLQAESRAILDPVAASQWAARQRFGRAVKVSQGAPRHMAAGEHTVAAAAKNCIAMAPTSWRSIEGGSSARLACIRCFCALSARGFISSWHAEIPRNIDARTAFYSSKRNSAF